MVKRKITFIGGIFLIGIILSISFVLSAYELSNPKYTRYYSGGGFYNSVSTNIDEDFCNNGQDFFIQISPIGCDPSVVRTDLLEEQNVPVFCPLTAIQINPFIKVNAIEDIVFKGKNSKYIQDVGFHPAKAALGNEGDLNSPALNNIGYVVVVLNEQENASNIPDYISGNLTATIRYNIENAFGIGSAEFYLPEMNEKNFMDNKNKYSFWDGRGFIRAESIGDNEAVLSIYDGTRKLNRFNLKKGETSPKLYLPGLDCLAGLNVKLVNLENPTTRVRLNIDGEVRELAKGEKFLEGRCEVRDINKKGLVQIVSLNCKEDDEGFFTNRNLELAISPKITLEIGSGDSKKTQDFIVGDKITTLGNGDKSLYIGYIGRDEKGPYIIPAVSTNDFEEDFKNSLFYQVIIPSSLKALHSNTGNFYSNALKNILVGIGTGSVELANYLGTGDFILPPLYIGENIKETDYWNDVPGSIRTSIAGLNQNIIFKGLALPTNEPLSPNIKKYYENAKQDYVKIISDFSNLKYPQEDKKTQGEKAYIGLIDLCYKLEQKATMLKYCDKFEKNYPDEYKQVKEKCEDTIKLVNSEISNSNVLINGKTRNIDLMGITEPSPEEYSASFNIRTPTGKEVPITLGKNDKFNMIYAIDNEVNPIYVVDTLYLKYNNGWYWTYAGEDWVSISSSKMERGDSRVDFVFPRNLEPLRTSLQRLNGGNTLLEGEKLIKNYGGYRKYSKDYIKLISLNEDSAVLEVNLESKRSFGTAVSSAGQYRISGNKIIKKGEVESFGSEYSFQLTNVNLKKQARVQIVPRVDNEETQANFSFKIGIEKRAIDLSPKEIEKRIDSLNNTINEWNEKSEKLGKVVKSLKGACLVAGVGLTTKNLLNNLGGEGIARQEQMQYWNDRCSNEINNPESDFYKEYVSKKLGKHIKPKIEDCYIYYSKDIDSSVNIRLELMKEQDKELEKCENSNSVTVTKNWLGTETINTDELKECYIQKQSYQDNLKDCLNEFKSELNEWGINKEEDFISKYIDSELSLSELKELELNCKMLRTSIDNEDKKLIEKNIKNKLKSIYELKKSQVEKQTFEKEYKVDVNWFSEIKEKDIRTLPIKTNKKWSQVKNNFENALPIDDGDSVEFVGSELTTEGKYLIVLDTNDVVKQTYKIIPSSSPNGKSSLELVNKNNKNPFNFRFERLTTESYENKYENPKASFYETEPYKEMPAIVPFDLKHGWYVYIQQTIPAGSSIKSYENSGRVASFWVCNVGENGREERTKGDDVCELINTGTGQPYNEFPGLSPSESKKYIDCANSAVQQASRQRKDNPKLSSIKISTVCDRRAISEVGEPAANIPTMQCENFMSPDDCKILYNLCDPVICPSSRCDLGGTYPVQDVVQSGIIGSIFLCLPNFVGFGGDVYIPVCLTGIKAGIDGFVSVLTAYRDCLQESLKTGKQIGICDEIHSVYLCDFFWKQGKPFADLILPKTLEFILGQNKQGGGEYLGIQNAWDTASKSMSYFTNYYAGNAFKAFRERTTKVVEQEVCKNFMSVSFPTSADLLDSFTEPDSPAQFHGRFDSMPFTDSTNPPLSQYKVYYHIYAGKDRGAYYKVYLKGDSEGTYYKDIGVSRIVANGYVKAGKYASETVDFTAPAGYKTLCIVVNNQEECGFGEISTSYAINYLKDKYIQEQVNSTDITTQEECISGSASIYQLLNPNMQSMAESAIDPAIYEKGITRICATENPGKSTDSKLGTPEQRWVDVGYCGQPNIRCWIDTSNVKDLIKNTGIEADTISELKNRTEKILRDDKGIIETPKEYDDEKAKILKDDNINELQKISKKNDLLEKLFLNSFKGDLLLERAREYKLLAIIAKQDLMDSCKKSCEGKNFDFAEIISHKKCSEKGGTTPLIVDSSKEVPQDFVEYCKRALGLFEQVFSENKGSITSNEFENIQKLYKGGALSEQNYTLIKSIKDTIYSDGNKREDITKILEKAREKCNNPTSNQLIKYSVQGGSGVDLSGTNIKQKCLESINNILAASHHIDNLPENIKKTLYSNVKNFLSFGNPCIDTLKEYDINTHQKKQVCIAVSNLLLLETNGKHFCNYKIDSCYYYHVENGKWNYNFTDIQKKIKKELDALASIGILTNEEYDLAMRYLIVFDKEKLNQIINNKCENLKDNSESFSNNDLVCCCYSEENEKNEEKDTSLTDSSLSSSPENAGGVGGNSVSPCSKYINDVKEYSEKYHIPADILMAVIMQESSCNAEASRANSDWGLMQITEPAFSDVCKGKINGINSIDNIKGVRNYKKNIECGAKILKTKYDLFNHDSCSSKSDCYEYPCNVQDACDAKCTNGNCEYIYSCNEEEVSYSGWDAALRAYNGWACNKGTVKNYVESVNSKREQAREILNNKIKIENVQLIQKESKLNLVINHNCDKVDFVIKRKDSFLGFDFLSPDNVIISLEKSRSTGVVKTYDLGSSNFEVGKSYYAEAICYDEKGEEIDSKKSDSIKISELSSSEKNDCEKAFNKIIAKLKSENENDDFKSLSSYSTYRRDILNLYLPFRYIENNDYLEIINSGTVKNTIKTLEKIKSKKCSSK